MEEKMITMMTGAVRSIIREELAEVKKDYIELLNESEKRIDKTNRMIDTLATAVDSIEKLMEKLTNTYEAHITSIESARDTLVNNNADLIKANMQLTHLTSEIEKNAQSVITGLRAELQSAKTMYNEMRTLLESASKTQINIERK